MKARVLRTAAMAILLYLVVSDGGPRSAIASSLLNVFGGDPTPESTCDTTGLNDPYCESQPGQSCQIKVNRCKTANKGIEQDKLCDAKNGTGTCGGRACVASTNDILKSQTCTKMTP